MYSEITSLEMSISFDKLTAKQLICECLDVCTAVLKDLAGIYAHSSNEQSPFAASYNDFYGIINWVLEPSKLEWLFKHFSIQDGDKGFVRNYLFELKFIRNLWAHSATVEFRLAHRAFDTLEFLLGKLNVNKDNDFYRKVNSYRKLLAVKMAQEYLNQEKQAALLTQQQQLNAQWHPSADSRNHQAQQQFAIPYSKPFAGQPQQQQPGGFQQHSKY